jgi:hypothetical protein
LHNPFSTLFHCHCYPSSSSLSHLMLMLPEYSPIWLLHVQNPLTTLTLQFTLVMATRLVLLRTVLIYHFPPRRFKTPISWMSDSNHFAWHSEFPQLDFQLSNEDYFPSLPFLNWHNSQQQPDWLLHFTFLLAHYLKTQVLYLFFPCHALGCFCAFHVMLNGKIIIPLPLQGSSRSSLSDE